MHPQPESWYSVAWRDGLVMKLKFIKAERGYYLFKDQQGRLTAARPEVVTLTEGEDHAIRAR